MTNDARNDERLLLRQFWLMFLLCAGHTVGNRDLHHGASCVSGGKRHFVRCIRKRLQRTEDHAACKALAFLASPNCLRLAMG